MTEETTKKPPERTPEQQAAHDKEMKERVNILLSSPLTKIHAQAAFCLADMLRAVIEGRLKPEDIPPTPSEIIVVTYAAVSRKLLGMKIRGMLSGNA